MEQKIRPGSRMTAQIPCHFCKRLTRPINTREGALKNYQLNYNRAFQCDYHGVSRVWHVPASNDPNIMDVVLLVRHKEGLFTASFFFGYDPSIGMKFRVDEINKYPKTNITILTLDFHPELTPENIDKKLPTMIMFS